MQERLTLFTVAREGKAENIPELIMETEATIRRQDNSIGVELPQSILRETGFQVRQTVSLQTTPEGLMIKARRKRYPATELNAQCDTDAPLPDDLAEWENMPKVGLEVV